jgi:hypothetical protein
MRLLPMLLWGLVAAVEEHSSSSPEHITRKLDSEDPVVSRLIEEEWEVIDSTSSTTTTLVRELTVDIPEDDVSSDAGADIDSNAISIGSKGGDKQTDERLDNFNTGNWWMYVLLIAFFSKIIASYVA